MEVNFTTVSGRHGLLSKSGRLSLGKFRGHAGIFPDISRAGVLDKILANRMVRPKFELADSFTLQTRIDGSPEILFSPFDTEGGNLVCLHTINATCVKRNCLGHFYCLHAPSTASPPTRLSEFGTMIGRRYPDTAPFNKDAMADLPRMPLPQWLQTRLPTAILLWGLHREFTVTM